MKSDLPDWSALDHDLLVLIAVRVPLIEDFMAFRGVCTSWKAAASKNKFKPSQPIIPLLMLPEKEDSNDREFYSLTKKKICMRLSLPHLKGNICVEVRFGWILTTEHYSGEVHLFNPLSGTQIELPTVNINAYTISRAVLSANPSNTSNFVLMGTLERSRGLGVWRAGEKSWTEFNPLHRFSDVTYYNGKFYAARPNVDDYEIWVWDPYDSDLPMLSFVMEAGVPYPPDVWEDEVAYFVESSDGELLLFSRDKDDFYTVIGVTRLDIVASKWDIIAGVEKDVVFLGRNVSMCFAASAFADVVVKPNCIYFTGDGRDSWVGLNGGIEEMGIFNLESDRIESDLNVSEYSYISGWRSLWIAPSS